MNAPTHPFTIRFDDARHIGGYFDKEFPTENAARAGMENIKRKRCRTDARLYINGLCSFAYWGKTGRAATLARLSSDQTIDAALGLHG